MYELLLRNFEDVVNKKTYLSDGAYVGISENGIVLYTTDGIRVMNEVYLDAQGLEVFINWIKELQGVSTL